MAYVKTRTTSSGAVSTALVESRRDEQGRPRQRVLANLYGCPDPLSALAKLAAERAHLREERDRLAANMLAAEEFYATVTTSTLAGQRFSAEERKEIDRLMQARKRLLSRTAAIDAALERVQKDGAAIRKHCGASEAEVQAAIKKHRSEVERAQKTIAGGEYLVNTELREARTQWRRLTIGRPIPTHRPRHIDG
jgi:chromosome segregation ATPase